MAPSSDPDRGNPSCAAGDAEERRAILRGLLERVDRQVAALATKAARLGTMPEEAGRRRAHLRAHLGELEGGRPAHEAEVSAR